MLTTFTDLVGLLQHTNWRILPSGAALHSADALWYVSVSAATLAQFLMVLLVRHYFFSSDACACERGAGAELGGEVVMGAGQDPDTTRPRVKLVSMPRWVRGLHITNEQQ